MTKPAASAIDVIFASADIPASETVPEWLHLIHKGPLTTDDGQKGFAWDGKPVKLCSWSGQRDVQRVPIDVNHSNSKAGVNGADTPAHGWVVELAVRDDGLWGRVDWNPSGRALMENRSYRAVSPELMVSKADGLIRGIRAVSLTNFPALPGLKPIFNSATTTEDTDMKFMELLCAALKLQAGASETAILAGVTALAAANADAEAKLLSVAKAVKAPEGAEFSAVLASISQLGDPANTVPKSAVEGLQAELASMSKQLNELQAGGARATATAFVDAAIAEGRVGVKPMRDHYIARHMSSGQGAAEVEKELGSLPIVKSGQLLTGQPPKSGETALTDADAHVARLMGISPEAMKKSRAEIAAIEENN